MAHADTVDTGSDTTHAGTEGGGQQHPVGIYLKIWLLLFVLSAFSYMVDYYQLQGYLRWSLVMLFMILKAGFIVAIFMHMRWERMALVTVVLIPPLCLLVLVGLMAAESDYTLGARSDYFVPDEREFVDPAELHKSAAEGH